MDLITRTNDKAQRAFIATIATLQALAVTAGARMKDERGDGGGSALMVVLLSVAGVAAVGLVVGAVVLVINNSTPKLTP